MRRYDLAVIGGGPAGTSAAITAARHRKRVLLLERGRFPRHKVCGEFVSGESLGLLSELGRGSPELARLIADAPRITSGRIFADGRTLQTPIEPAAASIPRYDLDHALWAAAEALGVECRQAAAVERIEDSRPYRLHSWAGDFEAVSILRATGRWSNLSRHDQPHPASAKWLGVKAHYREQAPAPSVDLYFFDGGYCGIQPVGTDLINVCAMARTDRARRIEEVFEQSPPLRERSREWAQVTDAVTTAPLVFRKPTPLDGEVLLAGDAAGFVDPFVGDGISIALRSGVLAAEAIVDGAPERAAERYQRAYAQTVLPVFRSASKLRQLMELPRFLRAPILRFLGTPIAARYVVRKTRARS